MELTYTVNKEKGGRYFVCKADGNNEPISGSFGDKKKALHIAADLMGIPYKEYLKMRKKAENPVDTTDNPKEFYRDLLLEQLEQM